MLYLLIFGHALEDHVKVYDQRRHTPPFWCPALAMMSCVAKRVCQQLVIAHHEQGHGQPGVSDAHAAVVLALVCGLRGRGGCARPGGGLGRVSLVSAWFTQISFVAPLWIVVFAVLGAALMGTLGLIAGLVG